jgi:hypothetical protein
VEERWHGWKFFLIFVVTGDGGAVSPMLGLWVGFTTRGQWGEREDGDGDGGRDFGRF